MCEQRMNNGEKPQTDHQTPENDLKRQWLGRYLDSRRKQERLAEQLKEVRSRATSVSQSWNPTKSSPTNAHSDRVADSVQQIEELERQLREEQERGQAVGSEIIHALYVLPLESFTALLCQYIDGMNKAEIAREMGKRPNTVSGYIRKGLNLLVLPENTY